MDIKFKSLALISLSLMGNLAFGETAPWWCTNEEHKPNFSGKTSVCVYEVQCPDGRCETISLAVPKDSFSARPLNFSNITVNQESGAEFEKLPANVTACARTNESNIAIGGRDVPMLDGSKKDGPTSCLIKLVNVKVDKLNHGDLLVSYQLNGGHRIDVKLDKNN